MIPNTSLKNFVSQHDVLRPVDWDKIFTSRAPLDLEIGCGNGEFIQKIAGDEQKRNFVGIDQQWERICKTLNKISASDLTNVRILLVDVRIALERLFKQRSIENIYCLFPCPWPKKKHIKHRLFSNDFLRLANSRLKDGGTLKIVTDFKPYEEWVLEEVGSSGFSVKTRTVSPQYDTKFERKWVEGGQKKFFEVLLKKNKHINVPVKKDISMNPCFIKKFNPKKFKFKDLSGCPAIVYKGMVWDEQRKLAMVQLVVAEENMTQHFWATILKAKAGWKVVASEGMRYIPTQGVAQAMRMVAEACK